MTEAQPNGAEPPAAKSDIVPRLRRWVATKAALALNGDLREAADAIDGLRATDERRLGELNSMKTVLRQLADRWPGGLPQDLRLLIEATPAGAAALASA